MSQSKKEMMNGEIDCISCLNPKLTFKQNESNEINKRNENKYFANKLKKTTFALPSQNI